MKSIAEEGLPRLLRRLVSGVSSRDFKLFRSQFNDIHDQIRACCESLDNSDDQVRSWVTQARELAYDMDDWFDLFYLCIYQVDTGGNPSSSGFLNWFRGRNDIGDRLRDLEARLKALLVVRPHSLLDRGALPVNRPSKLQLVNTECLVGLEAAVDEVTRMVTDAIDNAVRKIIPITGMAGSGKTMLAATVYQRLGQQKGFHFRAFVSIGQKPDLRSILKELLSQLDDKHNGNEEIDQLVSSIGALLKENRYLIVLDDLWSLRDWEKIKDCFPANNLGSRIITTTRDDELASKSISGSRDYIHKIGLFRKTYSEQLFLKQLEKTSRVCPQYWDDVSDEIMRSCGERPRALLSVAAMLAYNRSRDECKSLGSNLPLSSHMDRTKQAPNQDQVHIWIVRDVTDTEYKIVSITGMAGSGKTTLAAMVYQRLREQNDFYCRAFVSIGRKPDLRRILKELLSQLDDKHNGNEEIDQLVSSIEALLNEKRYLIVLDDLWSLRDWEKIKDCFPENNLGSRIITTTRDDELALKCSSGSRDYVHKIGLLSDSDSKQLLLTQLETTGHGCPQYWHEVSDQIMTRCGGLPLALVNVASMLAHRPSLIRDEWERLGLNLLSSKYMDGLKQALNQSYKDLPLHLKSCLLYLSIFPENYKVEVKRLVRLCTAEGFLSSDGLSKTGKEFGKKYLKELITRNMLQLQHMKNNHGTGSSWYCRLHPVIRDFIVCKSKEENFVTLADVEHQHKPIHQETIRRLSIQSSDKQGEALARNVTMDLSHAWSITIFGQAAATPRLTDLSLFVRVLDLEGCSGPVCLDGLLNLRLLKYLGLRGTDVSVLPTTISMLRYLVVLDVGFTKVKELPSSVGALQFLRYLSLRGTDVRELPETIGKLRYLKILDMKSSKVTQLPGSIDWIETRTRMPVTIQHCQDLQKLATIDLSNHLPSFVESLGQLRKLRVIALTWSFHQCSDESYRKALISSISNWSCLISLTIHCGLCCSMEFLGSLSDPPEGLEKFKVTAGRFASVPKWFSELNHLSFVQITVCKQGTEHLKILSDLPLLQRLILGLDFITENLIVIESGWFRKLERFSVDCPRPWLSFSAGSMQKLTYLELKLCACPVRETSVPSGIGNLQRIQEVSLCYNLLEEPSPNISMIVGAMRQAVMEHPNRIDLFINGTPQDYSADAAEEDANSAAGTRIGTDTGTDDELVNATKGIQSTSEIEEIESED